MSLVRGAVVVSLFRQTPCNLDPKTSGGAALPANAWLGLGCLPRVCAFSHSSTRAFVNLKHYDHRHPSITALIGPNRYILTP